MLCTPTEPLSVSPVPAYTEKPSVLIAKCLIGRRMRLTSCQGNDVNCSPMVKFLSRLPMRALYAFSGFLYFLAYYVVRHRHQVIREQLARVFPTRAEAERDGHPQALPEEFLRRAGRGAEVRRR